MFSHPSQRDRREGQSNSRAQSPGCRRVLVGCADIARLDAAGVLSWTHSQEGATISFYVDVTSASGMGSGVQLTGKSRPLLGWVW